MVWRKRANKNDEEEEEEQCNERGKNKTNRLQILKSFRLHELLNFRIRFDTIAKTKNVVSVICNFSENRETAAVARGGAFELCVCVCVCTNAEKHENVQHNFSLKTAIYFRRKQCEICMGRQ